MSPDWALNKRIVPLVATEIGMTDVEIAECLDAPLADVRLAARILYRQRRIDMCAGYVVAVPSRVAGRRAA